MSIIFLLMPIALLMGLGFLVAFLRMASQGQYDDLETPAFRMLIDDDIFDPAAPAAKLLEEPNR